MNNRREGARVDNRVTRRNLLRTGTVAALAGRIAVGTPSDQDIENIEASESARETEVPDTLDLAERGACAINALTGAADPEHGYESYHGAHLDQQRPYMSHRYGGPCMQKAVHALPMMRVMSGSTLNGDFDTRMMEAIIRDIDGDGLWWFKVQGRPWRAETYKRDFVNVSASGRFMVALADWYRYDHDSQWLSLLDRMGNGLSRIAIQQDGYTMYHDSFLRSGWRDPKSSPLENGQIYVNGYALRGFTQWYTLTGQKKALEMAQKLARYMQSPATGTWKPTEGPSMVAASEHARWEGHFHTHTMGMIGLIEYANQLNDTSSKMFVRDFYEYSRGFGMSRVGFFPAVVGPVKKINESSKATGMPDEGCAVADMTLLAILLSDGGIGDYWDDVDQYVRNQLVEQQILRRDLVDEIVSAGPQHRLDRRMETDERVVERQLGAFISISDPTMSYAWWTMCCLGNCSVALYKAWESIVRFKDGTAQVNLLLNRTSAGLDVESYLPYEGKVVLRNKAARNAFVRIPAWVDKKALRCRVNQQQRQLRWSNNYLIIEGLASRDAVTLEFPMVDSMEEHTEPAYAQKYQCQFKGNTLVDISPRAARPVRRVDTSDDGSQFAINKGYPLYQRESYQARQTPVKKVKRYISPVLI